MEVQELETSHIELTKEKLRLLEIQVAGLISDVIMLKAWKSEMSKLNLSADISRAQSEAVVPTSDIKQEQLSSSMMEAVNDQEATQECFDTSISCIQPEAVVPTLDVKQEQAVSDTVTETANHQEAAQSCDTSISSIQPESVVPTSDVKQEQIVSDTIMETAKDQKAPQESSDAGTLYIQPDSVVPTSDVKQEQVVSDSILETSNGQIAAQEHSDAGMSANVDCSSSASTVESASTEKCGKEDQEASPSKCIPSEHGTKQSGSSSNSQQEASASSQESTENGATSCRIGNKHSVLEKLVQSTVKFGASEYADKRNTARDSSEQKLDRQKTNSHSPEKQKTELHNYGDENKKTMHSPDKHELLASSVQTTHEDDSKQELQSKDKPKEVEKNALIAYMLKHNAALPYKKEEEQIMQDTSVTIKEKMCQTCQCKIATPKVTQGSEEDDTVSIEVIKKMSKEKLEKKYLQMVKRHQTLVNAICDSSTLRFPDDPHALLNAARDGNLEEAILLTFSAAMMEFRDEDGYTPLHLAVWNEHIHICKLLLAYNMPVNVKDSQGNTPLHFAARKGNVDICSVLLNWLAPLNATNTSGSTPLHCAVKEGHGKVCFLLVTKGASVNLCDKWNNTALHMAACNGFLEICELLVKQGASMNAQNCMGSTPLHNACKAGHFEVVQYLVKKGARLSIKCNKGKTPKDVINTLTHSNLLEWVTKYEKRICSDLGSILVNLN